MIQAGIIDPTKVERVALQNAASVASLLLTTEALITDLPEDKPAAAPPMPHGDFLGRTTASGRTTALAGDGRGRVFLSTLDGGLSLAMIEALSCVLARFWYRQVLSRRQIGVEGGE